MRVSAGGPPSGVVTFLFTDVEGSTRRWEADADAIRASLLKHDDVLRTAIEEHEGFLFSHTGDGVGAAFVGGRIELDDLAGLVDHDHRVERGLQQRGADHLADMRVGLDALDGIAERQRDDFDRRLVVVAPDAFADAVVDRDRSPANCRLRKSEWTGRT